MIGSRIHLRLFIDGVELPVTAVGCSFSEGQGAQCTATIIPIDEMHDIRPRGLVTIFYLDSKADDVKIQSRPAESETLEDPGTPTASIDEYKLLFMGEMVGISYQKTPSGRAANINCMDLMSYLDSIKMYGANYSSGGIEQIENAFQGARLGRSRSTTATGKDLKTNLVNWISEQKTEVDGEEKENIVIGIHRALREIFFSGNYFYSKAFNRLRLNDQLVGLPDDKSSINLFDLKYFKKFYDATLARQGALVSARDIVNTLLAPIMYNMVTVPCPYLNEDGDESRVYNTDGSSLESKITDKTAFQGAMLNQFVLKPDSWFFAPPSCNVIFPHMYSDFRIDRDFLKETTRFILRTDDLIQGQAYQQLTWNYFAGQFVGNVAYVKPRRLKDRIYAPDIEEFAVLMGSGSGQGHLADLNGLLMNHERFTGPITDFGYAGALGQYVSKANRRKYMGFFTDYMFWKYRFQGRGGQVTMAFNPNIVPGFPAVILDRPLTALEKAEGKYRRHYIGHVVSVSHQISPQGATTHVSMVAVRPYDESIDFEAIKNTDEQDADPGEGSSLERIAMGFAEDESYFDERYAPENIGDDYYQHILGCDSIVDQFKANVSLLSSEFAHVLIDLPGYEEELTVAKSILYLSSLYDTVIESGADVNAFANGLTWRPKTTITQIIGSSSLLDSEPTSQNTPSVKTASDYTGSGFMAGAVDPESEDAKLATYQATEQQTVTVTTTTREPADTVGGGFGPTSSFIEVPTTSTAVVAADAGTASYGLDEDLKDRQERLQKYLDAIRYRGIRG
jgi:hypothetical protein